MGIVVRVFKIWIGIVLGVGLMGLDELVFGVASALKLWFALQVEQHGCFAHLAHLEHLAHDVFAVHRPVLLEECGDDVGNGAGLVAALGEGVNAAANQHKTLVFDEFVVDSLLADVVALEVLRLDGLGDVAKVQRRVVVAEYHINLVANVARVDDWPAD